MSYNPVNPNGQTTKANSTPVTLASDQNNALETGGNLASISTNLTNGSQATKITDSLGHNANVIPLANYKPLAVGMVDGNGDQITSFGGGVQYTYGDVPDGTATGTLSMQVDGASGVAIPLFAVQGATKVNLVNSNNGTSFVGSQASSSSLPVVIASDQSTLPISGTVTANIGTADGISTSAIQTNGNQITQVKDASANALQVAQGSTTFGQTGPIVQTATTTSAPTYTTGKTNPLSTDTSGNLRTTISNASIPITSSGTLTVSDSSAGTTATNTTGLKDTVGTLSAGTAATKSLAVGGVYNSSAPTPTTGQQLSLQLDSSGNLKISGTVTANLGTIDGAATTAKQPALGTAGTPSSDVLTVQGASSMTALKVDGSGTTQPVSGTITANLGTLNGGATATNQTDGSQKTKIVDGSGNVIGATSNALDVNIKSGGSGGTQYTNSSAQATPTGTVALGYDGTNVRAIKTNSSAQIDIRPLTTSDTVTVNNSTAGNLKVDLSGTSANATAIKVDGSNYTQPVSLASLPTGANTVGNVGLNAGTNTIGTVNLSPTTGGWTNYFANAITTTVTVSSAGGKFGGYILINLNASPVYLQCFDTTAAVTLGSTVPTFVLTIPANATAANGLAANLEITNGAILNNGLKIAATTTPTGSSTVSTGITGTIWYH